MNPDVGQFVKVMFNNGTAVEGIVVQWSDDKSVLKSKNKESLLIIQKTKQDVLSVIINLKYKEQNKIIQNNDNILENNVIEQEIKKEFDEVKNKSLKDDLRLKKLVELKSELNRLEKEKFLNQFRSHEMTQVGSVGNYVLPNFTKKPRFIQYPSKENQREDVRDHSKLYQMFENKNKNSR